MGFYVASNHSKLGRLFYQEKGMADIESQPGLKKLKDKMLRNALSFYGEVPEEQMPEKQRPQKRPKCRSQKAPTSAERPRRIKRPGAAQAAKDGAAGILSP